MKTEWKVIDIVAASMESNIRINFRPGKRFYRVRLRDCCGIFDMRSHCFLTASESIFSSEFEREYKKAENDLEAIERLVEEFCAFDLPFLSSDLHNVTQQEYA